LWGESRRMANEADDRNSAPPPPSPLPHAGKPPNVGLQPTDLGRGHPPGPAFRGRGEGEADLQWMRSALALARRGLGNVWPNPAVGCVLVRDGRVVGRGWTQPGGRPHAETEALRRAGAAARGATAYVSLEPCSHWGRTPPCAEALIGAGITRVLAAIEDPDPRVAGTGTGRLRAAGIAVEIGLGAAEATEINAGFLIHRRLGRPLVTLKLATSLDARIATSTGESRWISGPEARALSHKLRAEHDAVMVGTGTVVVDDPQLTCRLPGLEDRSPVRVVLDRQLRIPRGAQVFADAHRTATWVVTVRGCDPVLSERVRATGASLIEAVADHKGRIDLAAALHALGARGLTRLMVEGGGRLAAALLRARLVDRVVWIHAPLLIGADGVPAVAGFGVVALDDAPRFERMVSDTVGEDAITVFRVRE
jgi:diaminohydroxyphosphoribosylaminopyrimidine deaminase / 5-amino-6-(5-phosphoribosylamino)uracil reductase